jgi:hypothetical protein
MSNPEPLNYNDWRQRQRALTSVGGQAFGKVAAGTGRHVEHGFYPGGDDSDELLKTDRFFEEPQEPQKP